MLRPILFLTFGIFTCFKPVCEHSSPTENTPRLSFSYFGLIISLVHFPILCYIVYVFILKITDPLSSFSKILSENFNFEYEIMCCFSCYFAVKFCLFSMRGYVRHVEFLIVLVFRRNDFGIKYLITQQNLKEIRKQMNFLSIHLFVYIFFKMITSYKKQHSFFDVLNEVGKYLLYFSPYFIIAQLLLLLKIYFIIFRSFEDCLKFTLSNNTRQDQNLVEKLQKFRLFYILTVGNYKKVILILGDLLQNVGLFLATISAGVYLYWVIFFSIDKGINDHVIVLIDLIWTNIYFWCIFYTFCYRCEKLSQSVSRTI